jgi:uncharacterized membrane protein YiaA
MSDRQQPSYVKYSGIGFQLIILTIGLVLVGKWLDGYFNAANTFMLISIFIAVFAVMYVLIKKLK